MSSSPLAWRQRHLWAILLLGLGLRLIAVDQPLIDRQAWRQTDTAAIARNYYEEACNLLWPRVDWRGTTPGYVEMNFPAYPFAVAVLYHCAGGVHEWLGRLLSALLSTGTAGLLYLLARRMCSRPSVGTLSALIYLITPLSLYFGRTFLPAGAMLFLSVATLLSFDRWCEEEGGAAFVVAAFCAALCFLVKIPTLYLGFPLVAMAWNRWGRSFLSRPLPWLYLLLVLLPAVAWYYHAHRLFEQTGLTFGIWQRTGYDKWNHALLLDPGFYLVMLRRFCHSVFTPVGSVAVVLGILLRPRTHKEWILYVWLGSLMLYLLVIPEGNRGLHYYQLPFVPVGALFAGRFLARVLDGGEPDGDSSWLRSVQRCPYRTRLAFVSLVVLGTGAYSAWAVGDYYVQPRNVHNYYRSCHMVGKILDERLPPDALLVVGDLDANAGAPLRAQSPTMLYYCHRKGWQITPEEFSAARLDSLAALGADFFVAAAGFVAKDTEFWHALLERGATTAVAYPHFWTDDALYRKALRRQPGAVGDFVLVRLKPR